MGLSPDTRHFSVEWPGLAPPVRGGRTRSEWLALEDALPVALLVVPVGVALRALVEQVSVEVSVGELEPEAPEEVVL